jgi:phosphatidate cytidylyltransferase
MAKSNLFYRVAAAVVGIPLVLALVYLGGWWFFGFALAVAVVSYYEFAAMTKRKGGNPPLALGLLGVAALVLNARAPFAPTEALLAGLVAVVAAAEMFRNAGSAIHNVGVAAFGLLYLGLLPASFVLLRDFFPGDLGAWTFFSLLAAIWISDSAAYFGGRALGKHKLFERISPKKTVEGALFGLAFAVGAAFAARAVALDYLSVLDAVVFGVVVGVAGPAGDLIESMLKRDAGVKDSSNIIPGHGGFFDRWDSLLLAAPAFYYYLRYLAQGS